jgi:hypothetical protein
LAFYCLHKYTKNWLNLAFVLSNLEAGI